MPSHRNRHAYDIHDATLAFVETILAPLKPPDRAEWARTHLPKTSGLALTRRDFEALGRTRD